MFIKPKTSTRNIFIFFFSDKKIFKSKKTFRFPTQSSRNSEILYFQNFNNLKKKMKEFQKEGPQNIAIITGNF